MPGESPTGRVWVSVILPTYNEAQNLPDLVPAAWQRALETSETSDPPSDDARSTDGW
jgi:hypothetical protein